MLRRPAVGRGRPGLLGTMARTAVVAGTATATANAVGRRQSRRDQQHAEEEAAPQAAQTAQVQEPPADQPPAGNDMMSQLKQLADMKTAGMLSDQEFTAAKAKLLGS
jgi:Short C-terminal domain